MTAVTVGSPVPVTVNVYVPAVVPFAVFPPGACQKSPQPARPPSAAMIAKAPSIDRQLRRRAGIPKSTRKASVMPLPAPIHPLPVAGRSGCTSWVVVVTGAVVVTVAVTVPLVAEELNATVVGDSAQVGKSTAPVGDAVSAQVSVAVPE